MHSLLHDIPQFLILLLEELFLIFNQILSIQAFGRPELVVFSLTWVEAGFHVMWQKC